LQKILGTAVTYAAFNVLAAGVRTPIYAGLGYMYANTLRWLFEDDEEGLRNKIQKAQEEGDAKAEALWTKELDIYLNGQKRWKYGRDWDAVYNATYVPNKDEQRFIDNLNKRSFPQTRIDELWSKYNLSSVFSNEDGTPVETLDLTNPRTAQLHSLYLYDSYMKDINGYTVLESFPFKFGKKTKARMASQFKADLLFAEVPPYALTGGKILLDEFYLKQKFEDKKTREENAGTGTAMGDGWDYWDLQYYSNVYENQYSPFDIAGLYGVVPKDITKISETYSKLGVGRQFEGLEQYKPHLLPSEYLQISLAILQYTTGIGGAGGQRITDKAFMDLLNRKSAYDTQGNLQKYLDGKGGFPEDRNSTFQFQPQPE
jgi:hypothetical protein